MQNIMEQSDLREKRMARKKETENCIVVEGKKSYNSATWV